MRDTVTVGNVELNGDRYCLVVANEDIPVTLYQFRILYCLMLNKGDALTYDQLIDAYKGGDAVANLRTISNHVSRINQKIGFRFIKSVSGVGYMVREEATL